MYGVGWLVFMVPIVVVGTIIAFALTAWVPIFALMVLVVAAVVGFAYLAGKRAQIGTERERIDRGDMGGTPTQDAAPAEGEGARRRSSDGEGYEPAL